MKTNKIILAMALLIGVGAKAYSIEDKIAKTLYDRHYAKAVNLVKKHTNKSYVSCKLQPRDYKINEYGLEYDSSMGDIFDCEANGTHYDVFVSTYNGNAIIQK